MFQFEAEAVGVEADRPYDILDLIPHAMHGDGTLRRHC
jgi:hypothetical protein